jgi:hypothetical protein
MGVHLDALSYHRREEATYYGQMGEWLKPTDCKSVAYRLR